jgi:hypothetical protein
MAAISEISRALNLESLSPEDAFRKLSQYFENHFSYSLDLEARGSDGTPLQDFLLRLKRGHCEFFATATVLLLRKAGIPARYAVGYSAQEFSRLENCIVVRVRHAHAWTLAYIEGTWRNFDTTPASWVGAEEETASFLEPLKDFFSFILFKFDAWRWSDREEGTAKYIGWLLIPLVIIICWRFYSRRQIKREREKSDDKVVEDIREGSDSAFYLIEEKLVKSGYSRPASETLTGWLNRIGSLHPHPAYIRSLKSILDLHYRYRFDPEGITADESELLKRRVASWLKKYEEIEFSASNGPSGVG